LGWLGGPPTTLLAPFVPLAFEAVLDGPHPVQEELSDLLEDMAEAQGMRNLRPVALQRGLGKWRAVGKDHRGVESATFEDLYKRVHGLLVLGLAQLEGDCKVTPWVSGKQHRATAVMDFVKAPHA
jgi:hypothetical protein